MFTDTNGKFQGVSRLKIYRYYKQICKEISTIIKSMNINWENVGPNKMRTLGNSNHKVVLRLSPIGVKYLKYYIQNGFDSHAFPNPLILLLLKGFQFNFDPMS